MKGRFLLVPRSVAAVAARALALAAMFLVLPGGAQVSPGNPQPNLATQAGGGRVEFEPVGSIEAAEQSRQLRRLNVERQKQIVAETAKLLNLTADYYGEVSQSSPDHLTVAQLRRLNEIEKLAKSIKQRMTTAFGAGPVFHDPGAYYPGVK